METIPKQERPRRRAMDNDQVISTIQTLLQDEASLNPQTAARLTLSIVSQLYLKIEELSNKFDTNNQKTTEDIVIMKKDLDGLERQVAELQHEVLELQAVSMVLWAQKHPKMATTIITVLFLVSVFAVELKDYIFALLGFKLP